MPLFQTSNEYQTITSLPFSVRQLEQLKCQVHGYSLLSRNLTLPTSIFQKLMDPYPSSVQPSHILHRLFENIPWNRQLDSTIDPWSLTIFTTSYLSTDEKISDPLIQKPYISKESLLNEIHYRENRALFFLEEKESALFKHRFEKSFFKISTPSRQKVLMQMQKKVLEEILSQSSFSTCKRHEKLGTYQVIPSTDFLGNTLLDDSLLLTRAESTQYSRLRIGSIVSRANIKKNESMKNTEYLRNLGNEVIFYHFHLCLNLEKNLRKKKKKKTNLNLESGPINHPSMKSMRILPLSQETSSVMKYIYIKKGSQNSTANSYSFVCDSENIEDFKDFSQLNWVRESILAQPTLLVGGNLTSYQLNGLEWMVFLYNNQFNGILADDKGLGKTVQTISLITFLLETKQQPGPYLIIVPMSNITNWFMEFKKWAPSIATKIFFGTHHQAKQLENQIVFGKFHVFLTTLDFVAREKSILSKVHWLYTIIDDVFFESKKTSKWFVTTWKFFTSRYRLILTRTGSSKNLPELLSLVDFILPSRLNKYYNFDDYFLIPTANSFCKEKIQLSKENTTIISRNLNQILEPFTLRRCREEVEPEIPNIVQKIIRIKLSSVQLKLYQHVQSRAASILQHRNSLNQRHMLKNAIFQMQKICNHPFLVQEFKSKVLPNYEINDMIIQVSGKFQILNKILAKVRTIGHRLIVCFQTDDALRLMSDFLTYRGYLHLQLCDSSNARDRSECLQLFNQRESPYGVLLITTSNRPYIDFSAAKILLLFDSNFIKDEYQISDTTKFLKVLKLVTENTIEEDMVTGAFSENDISVLSAFDARNCDVPMFFKNGGVFEFSSQNIHCPNELFTESKSDIDHFLAKTDSEAAILKQINEVSETVDLNVIDSISGNLITQFINEIDWLNISD